MPFSGCSRLVHEWRYLVISLAPFSKQDNDRDSACTRYWPMQFFQHGIWVLNIIKARQIVNVFCHTNFLISKVFNYPTLIEKLAGGRMFLPRVNTAGPAWILQLHRVCNRQSFFLVPRFRAAIFYFLSPAISSNCLPWYNNHSRLNWSCYFRREAFSSMDKSKSLVKWISSALCRYLSMLCHIFVISVSGWLSKISIICTCISKRRLQKLKPALIKFSAPVKIAIFTSSQGMRCLDYQWYFFEVWSCSCQKCVSI